MNQPKYTCLKHPPLTTEFELDCDVVANVITPDATANYKDIYSEATTTKTLEIQHGIVFCDVAQNDPELMSNYDAIY